MITVDDHDGESTNALGTHELYTKLRIRAAMETRKSGTWDNTMAKAFEAGDNR